MNYDTALRWMPNTIPLPVCRPGKFSDFVLMSHKYTSPSNQQQWKLRFQWRAQHDHNHNQNSKESARCRMTSKPFIIFLSLALDSLDEIIAESIISVVYFVCLDFFSSLFEGSLWDFLAAETDRFQSLLDIWDCIIASEQQRIIYRDDPDRSIEAPEWSHFRCCFGCSHSLTSTNKINGDEIKKYHWSEKSNCYDDGMIRGIR